MTIGTSTVQHRILAQLLIAAEQKANSPLNLAVERLMKDGVTQQDIHDLYVMLADAGAPRELLGAVGSRGDTLNPEAVLEIVELCSPKM